MSVCLLVDELASEFDEVPRALIASTVQAAAVRPEGDLAVEDIARADVAALALAMRRGGTTRPR